ncbi:hypothetical protein MASR2M78_28840 [Treponema sp.]
MRFQVKNDVVEKLIVDKGLSTYADVIKRCQTLTMDKLKKAMTGDRRLGSKEVEELADVLGVHFSVVVQDLNAEYGALPLDIQERLEALFITHRQEIYARYSIVLPALTGDVDTMQSRKQVERLCEIFYSEDPVSRVDRVFEAIRFFLEECGDNGTCVSSFGLLTVEQLRHFKKAIEHLITGEIDEMKTEAIHLAHISALIFQFLSKELGALAFQESMTRRTRFESIARLASELTNVVTRYIRWAVERSWEKTQSEESQEDLIEDMRHISTLLLATLKRICEHLDSAEFASEKLNYRIVMGILVDFKKLSHDLGVGSRGFDKDDPKERNEAFLRTYTALQASWKAGLPPPENGDGQAKNRTAWNYSIDPYLLKAYNVSMYVSLMFEDPWMRHYAFMNIMGQK